MEQSVGAGWIDYSAVFLFFAMMVAIGIFYFLKTKNTSDYIFRRTYYTGLDIRLVLFYERLFSHGFCWSGFGRLSAWRLVNGQCSSLGFGINIECTYSRTLAQNSV